MPHIKHFAVLASVAALSLARGAWAEEAESISAPGAEQEASSPIEPAMPGMQPPGVPQSYSAPKAFEQHQALRNQRYQELRQQAAEVGLDLPETPPWEEVARPPAPHWMGGDEGRRAPRESRMQMTPEEREAQRTQRYQEIRERAKQRGVELPETPPWKERAEDMQKTMDVIAGMTPEQRAAFHFMHRMHMMQQMSRWMDRPEWPAPGSAPAAPGAPGYGYGAAPYGPGGYRY